MDKIYQKTEINDQRYIIDWGLTSNPNTPPENLRKIAKKNKEGFNFDSIDKALLNNPNTPEDVKTTIKPQSR